MPGPPPEPIAKAPRGRTWQQPITPSPLAPKTQKRRSTPARHATSATTTNAVHQPMTADRARPVSATDDADTWRSRPIQSAAVRIVFFGTPQFAVPTLEALAREHEIVAGRGAAGQAGRPRDEDAGAGGGGESAGARAAAAAAAEDSRRRVSRRRSRAGARARRSSSPTERSCRPRCWRSRSTASSTSTRSILPKYRGAAPIQRAIEHGETTTGVTIMRVDEELDHGPMLRDREDADRSRRAHAVARGAPLDARRRGAAARAARVDADRDAAGSRAGDVRAEDREERRRRSTGASRRAAIYDKFRAFDPWPGVFTGELKLIDIAPADGRGDAGNDPRDRDDGVVVATGDGALRLITVQRPGKPRSARRPTSLRASA